MNLFKRTQIPQEQRREHKTVHYTLTPIGTGPEALAAWKADRERFEAEWQLAQAPKREERRLAAIEAVAEQNARVHQTALEIAESLYLDTGATVDVQQLRAVITNGENMAQIQKDAELLWRPIKASWLTRLWRAAFPE